jgi:hypothetical protein
MGSSILSRTAPFDLFDRFFVGFGCSDQSDHNLIAISDCAASAKHNTSPSASNDLAAGEGIDT